jgi:hypothetical protein
MSDKNLSARAVAELAEQLFAGDLGYREFIARMPESPDNDDVAALIDLIVHEPRVGGPMGVSESEHDEYLARVDELIVKLKGD